MARKGNRKIVMIIDDDPSRRKYLYDILKLAGVDLLSASSGSDAMARIRSETPDLILLNMHSPKVGGLYFIKELRLYGLGQKIVVAAMVGDEAKNRTDAKAAGADDLLERNPSPHDLVALVGRRLGIEKFQIPTNDPFQGRGVKEEVVRARPRTDPEDSGKDRQ